jgi:peptidoglycan hydrolase-like protein with peptidoglycan-binding domain
MPTLTQRLGALTQDGNLDLEDLLFAIQSARADGRLSTEELVELQIALAPHRALLEPATQRLVDDLLRGTVLIEPRRVLLAQTPAGEPDLYQPRAEVLALQDALTVLGLTCKADGVYGAGTASRVRELQSTAGLPQTGQVDTATLLALNERLVAQGREPLDLLPRARIRPDQVVALRGAGDPGDIRAIQAGLGRLAVHLGDPALRAEGDAGFGAATEGAVRAFQRRFYLPETGIVDRTTLATIDEVLTRLGYAATGVVGPTTGVRHAVAAELHFYPGDKERKLYVLQGGREVARYAMVGGRARSEPDPKNPKVPYDPSPSGTYTVVRVSPHASMSWAWSYVPFGAALREVGGEVQYRDLDGTWRFATGPQGAFAGRTPPPLARASYLDEKGKLLEVWQLNDFGHLRAQLKSATTGQIQSHMIHSSPHLQGAAAYFQDTRPLHDPSLAAEVLKFSHGCEHIHPRDLDDLIARGYLAPGTRFVVHGYDEVRGGPAIS